MSVVETQSRAELIEDLRWKKFPALDDGFVTLVDVMGDDAAITQAARVSYGVGTKAVSDDRTLIRYLMRHRHTTPFEMAEIKVLVRVPMDCWRQWIRHRMASVNEYSTRYSEAIDSQQKTPPDQWRAQSGANKQGSSGLVTDWPERWQTEDPNEWHAYQGPVNTERSAIKSVGEYLSERESVFLQHARNLYTERLEAGVAREQARKDLPLSTYTEAYWKIDLHNLFHFLGLRMDSHAQQEIREYATIIGEQIVRPLFPLAWEAFVDYRMKAVTLTAIDQAQIHHLWVQGLLYGHPIPFPPTFLDEHLIQPLRGEKNREREECRAKLRELGILAAPQE